MREIVLAKCVLIMLATSLLFRLVTASFALCIEISSIDGDIYSIKDYTSCYSHIKYYIQPSTHAQL